MEAVTAIIELWDMCITQEEASKTTFTDGMVSKDTLVDILEKQLKPHAIIKGEDKSPNMTIEIFDAETEKCSWVPANATSYNFLFFWKAVDALFASLNLVNEQNDDDPETVEFLKGMKTFRNKVLLLPANTTGEVHMRDLKGVLKCVKDTSDDSAYWGSVIESLPDDESALHVNEVSEALYEWLQDFLNPEDDEDSEGQPTLRSQRRRKSMMSEKEGFKALRRVGTALSGQRRSHAGSIVSSAVESIVSLSTENPNEYPLTSLESVVVKAKKKEPLGAQEIQVLTEAIENLKNESSISDKNRDKELLGKIEVLEQLNHNREKELDDMKRQLTVKTAESQKELLSWKSKVTEVQAELQNVRNVSIGGSEFQMKEMKERIDALEDERAVLQSQLRESRLAANATEQLQEEVNKWKAQARKRADEITTLEHKNNEMKKNNELTERTIQKLRLDIQNLTKDIEAAEEYKKKHGKEKNGDRSEKKRHNRKEKNDDKKDDDRESKDEENRNLLDRKLTDIDPKDDVAKNFEKKVSGKKDKELSRDERRREAHERRKRAKMEEAQKDSNTYSNSLFDAFVIFSHAFQPCHFPDDRGAHYTSPPRANQSLPPTKHERNYETTVVTKNRPPACKQQ